MRLLRRWRYLVVGACGRLLETPCLDDYGRLVEPERPPKPTADVDPRYQPPLEAGWWRTADGWASILRSHCIDRRAKPVVIVFIVAMFFAFVSITDWSNWGFYAAIAGLLIIAVLAFSPLDPAAYVERQPLQPGWWRTRAGWKAMPSAGSDEPGMGVVMVALGVVLGGVVLAISGWAGWHIALAMVLLASRSAVASRYRWVLTVGVFAAIIAGPLLAGS